MNQNSKGWFPRNWLRRYYSQAINRPAEERGAAELHRPALIFSPHQDDETLGCGGTIIRKIGAGADITIVFMTDGRQSHGHLIPAGELVALRRQEATDASHVLGIKEDKVIFLDFEDGRLADFRAEAVNQVSAILAKNKPEEIYIPYAKEPPPDHYMTNKIVLDSLKDQRSRASIYEYPVWFWHHWPWVRVHQGGPRATREVLKNTWRSQFGWRLLKDFNQAIFVGDVLGRKRQALEQYRSQMTQLKADPRWLTLHDVSEGEFLACFFQDYELFRQYRQDPSK
ncbi:MAG: PIG-L deacetylase family protein [Chloroflexota bacterium]|jgi:LmbE family N-acetylglucosaminyl deacetylase